MDRIVGLSVLGLIVATIWLILPPTDSRTRVEASQIGQSGEVEARAGNPVRERKGDRSPRMIRQRADLPQKKLTLARQTGSSNSPSEQALTENINARVFAQNPVAPPKGEQALDAEASETEQVDNPFAHVPWDAESDYGDLEEALMKLYAARNADGLIPQKIEASQVLRESVLRDLNIPGNLPVLMIGDYNLDHPKVIHETLKKAKKGQDFTGFTFIDPSVTGGQRRVYVKVFAN